MFKIKEKILIWRVKSGDRKAFAQIYDYYNEPIYRFIYFKVSNQEDAQDLTSQTFTKILEYLVNKEEEIDNLRALFYQTARHLVIDFYRQRHQNIVSFDEEIGDTLTDSQQISVYDRMEIISDIKQVNQVIKQLPDQYREVIILRYIEELSVKETAKIIDRSEGATRVLLHRALNALKKLIGNRPTNR